MTTTTTDPSAHRPGVRPPRTALVFGATGFIGRWLVMELLVQGVATTAVVRSDRSAEDLLSWLAAHDVPAAPTVVRADFTRDDFGWAPAAVEHVAEVFNMAGAYAFGMTTEDARAANVDVSRRIVSFAATLPRLVRLVHLSGYRVGGQDPATVPWSEATVAREYRRLGAYEASKVESDAVVQAHANALGVPWSIVNPSTVIGDSSTGESPQTVGLGTTVLDLLDGRMPALPGGRGTFVPVVTVDYLAAFTALLATDEETIGQSYWVLDDDTPALPDLLRLVGADHQVPIPRLSVPVALLKRLPAKVTRADPETLSFLSSDRYPTGSANELASRHGLAHPDVRESLRRWSRWLRSQQPASEGRGTGRGVMTGPGLSLDAVLPLRTSRLTLRAATPEDADATWSYRRLPAVAEWLTELPTDLIAYRTTFAEPARLAATVIVERDGEIIGDFMLRVEDAWAQAEVVDAARNTQAELGYVLDPRSTGHGYATEAVQELIRTCFEDLHVRRVTANCFLDNTTSWRLMERVGMRRESHAVAESLHRSGRWLDTVTYAMLAPTRRDGRLWSYDGPRVEDRS